MLKMLIALETVPENFEEALERHELVWAPKNELLKTTIEHGGFDIVLFDGEPGLLSEAKLADPRTDIIALVDSNSKGIEAIQEGAFGFLTLPLETKSLVETVDRITETVRLKKETGALESELAEKYNTAGIVAKNPKMLEIIDFIRRVSPHYRSVTITGETGTGKEVAARALHFLSPVADKPFLTCNCGGLVETLLESELFGHVKGAFTGAISDKVGLFEAAGDGTLFLDEIGELPLSFQPKFLRVLQDGEFRPVGGNRSSISSCRIIAATSRNLADEVKKGTFREDLYYRLTPITVRLPPLRERKDDIPLLCRSLLTKFSVRTGKRISGISRPGQAALMAYNWPGNVRELDNVLEQASVLTTESFIRFSNLPEHIIEPGLAEGSQDLLLETAIEDHIALALESFRGNRTRAAKALGISRRSLQRKIEKYSLS